MKTSFTSYKPETMARAAFPDAPISFKTSIEVAKRIRGMMTDKAERYLEAVVAKKEAVPFTRFTNAVGHRKGAMAAGRYPVKAASVFLKLIRLGVANAENKGLGTPLRIVHISAQQASQPMHAGRRRGIAMKRTGLDLVLAETEGSKRQPRKAKKEKAVTTGAASPAEPKKGASTNAETEPEKRRESETEDAETEDVKAETRPEQKAEPKKAAPVQSRPVPKKTAKPKAEKAESDIHKEPKSKEAKKAHDHEDVN